MKDIIQLTTPKGQKVMVNFDHVVYCHKTHNKHTSVKFKYSLGDQRKGAYVVVVEDFEEILKKLDEN